MADEVNPLDGLEDDIRNRLLYRTTIRALLPNLRNLGEYGKRGLETICAEHNRLVDATKEVFPDSVDICWNFLRKNPGVYNEVISDFSPLERYHDAFLRYFGVGFEYLFERLAVELENRKQGAGLRSMDTVANGAVTYDVLRGNASDLGFGTVPADRERDLRLESESIHQSGFMYYTFSYRDGSMRECCSTVWDLTKEKIPALQYHTQ